MKEKLIVANKKHKNEMVVREQARQSLEAIVINKIFNIKAQFRC